MNNTNKTTFCAIIAALSTAIMLLSYFPYLTYAIPAMAGLFMMVVVIEINLKWATASYIASAVLVLIFAETEAKLMYVFLFGYYPILKAALERMRKPVIEWAVKIAVLNAAVLAVYIGITKIFGLGFDDMGDFGKYTGVVLLLVANVVFVLYDIAVSKMATFYMYRLHDKVRRLIKRK